MSSPAHPRPRVLLVEDSEDDAFFFRWTLHKCCLDCELVHVVDGAAAIAHLEACREGTLPVPDLLFVDLKLPVYSGFEVLEWINQHPFSPPLDIAVLSGSEHASDVERASALGAAVYLVKPISVERLQARFAEWHARHAAVGEGGAVTWAEPRSAT